MYSCSSNSVLDLDLKQPVREIVLFELVLEFGLEKNELVLSELVLEFGPEIIRT